MKNHHSFKNSNEHEIIKSVFDPFVESKCECKNYFIMLLYIILASLCLQKAGTHFAFALSVGSPIASGNTYSCLHLQIKSHFWKLPSAQSL